MLCTKNNVFDFPLLFFVCHNYVKLIYEQQYRQVRLGMFCHTKIGTYLEQDGLHGLSVQKPVRALTHK